ncbi:MAG: excinuclease ABC subunit A, partial [Planctomycetota bacterium]
EREVRVRVAAHFSFNSTKGRCPACDGLGATLVEMQFLSDLWLTCEECDGSRYAPEILEVRYRGRSIADVLAMSVEEALAFFEASPEIARILQTLADVGLGYMSLGQSSTTLSGGEAQRIKLASELWRADDGRSRRMLERSVVILDEPSTGLAASDVEHLARCLGRLARKGDAVVVIEHHTELLEICDRLVELGPEGGAAGGEIVAAGTPDELRANPRSITGPWLFKEPGGTALLPAAPARRPARARKAAPRRSPSAEKRSSARKGPASKGSASKGPVSKGPVSKRAAAKGSGAARAKSARKRGGDA